MNIFNLCLAHKDCFLILLAYENYQNIYTFFNLIGNTIQFGSFFYEDLDFLLSLKNFVNILGHNLLKVTELFHKDLFFILIAGAVIIGL